MNESVRRGECDEGGSVKRGECEEGGVKRQASNWQIVGSSPTRNRFLFYARLCTVVVHCIF